MRIVHIDNYEVCEENGKFLAASFVDYEGIPHTIELTKELEEYLKEVRNENEDVKCLEEALYDVTKATPDNHVLFSIELEDCCTLAIEFSDYKATFGIGVKKGRW